MTATTALTCAGFGISAEAFAQRTPTPGEPGGMHLFCSVDISDWGDTSRTYLGANYSGWTLDRVVALNDALDVAVLLKDSSGSSCGFVRVMNTGAISTNDATWYRILGPNGEHTMVEDINNNGVVVGWFENTATGVDNGFAWSVGDPPTLTEYFGGLLSNGGRIYGINDDGDLGGHEIQPSPLGPVALVSGAVSWINLPGLFGWTSDGVLGISERTATDTVYLVGQAENPSTGDIRGVDWAADLSIPSSTVHWLTPAATGDDICPVGVNADNLVAGWVDVGGSSPQGAYLWVPTSSGATAWEVIAFNSANYPHLNTNYFSGVQTLDMNERGEVVLATNESGGLWVWDGTFTTPTASNVHFLPIHWMMAYPREALDGTFRPEAINEKGVVAGSADAEVGEAPVVRLLLSVPYDTDNDAVPDYRERVSEMVGPAPIEGNDWIPTHDRDYRMGIYGMGNPNSTGNEALNVENVALARIFTTTAAVADFWQSKQTHIPAAINDFGNRSSGANAETLLWIRDPYEELNEDSNVGFDRVVIPSAYGLHADLLDAFRCVSYNGARSIDYIQLGNEAFTKGAPGALFFENVLLSTGNLLDGSWYEGMPAEDVWAGCELYNGWLQEMADAIREGSALAGRPIRIVTPSPLLGNLIPASKSDPSGGANPWDENQGGIFCYYTFKVFAKWSDFQDLHLHWDGSEEDLSDPRYTGLKAVGYVLPAVLDDWLFEDPPGSGNWLHTADAFPERVSVTEFGPKGQADWVTANRGSINEYSKSAGTVPHPDFNDFIENDWIDAGSLSPNENDPDAGIPEFSDALHDREFGNASIGPDKLSIHFGLYGNFLGPSADASDPVLQFVPSAIQQLGVHPNWIPSTPRFSLNIWKWVVDPSLSGDGELRKKWITGFDPDHDPFSVSTCTP